MPKQNNPKASKRSLPYQDKRPSGPREADADPREAASVPREHPVDPLQAIMDELGIGILEDPDSAMGDLSQMRSEVQEVGGPVAEDDEKEDSDFENYVEPPPRMDLAPHAVMSMEYSLTQLNFGTKSVQIGVDLREYEPYVVLISTTRTGHKFFVRVHPSEFIVLLKSDIVNKIVSKVMERRAGPMFDIGGLQLSLDKYDNVVLSRGNSFKFTITLATVQRLTKMNQTLRAALVWGKKCADVARSLCHEMSLYNKHNPEDSTLENFKSMTSSSPNKTLLLEEIKCQHLDFVLKYPPP